MLQREFSYCIIDEVDSILIDEARTPLIISGESDKPGRKYEMSAKIASVFERDFHYTVNEKAKSVVLQEKGYEDAEAALAVRALGFCEVGVSCQGDFARPARAYARSYGRVSGFLGSALRGQ